MPAAYRLEGPPSASRRKTERSIQSTAAATSKVRARLLSRSRTIHARDDPTRTAAPLCPFPPTEAQWANLGPQGEVYLTQRCVSGCVG